MRIREILKARGMTLRQLAGKIGVTPATVSQQLNGNPSYKTMEQIANALEIPMWQLFVSEEEISKHISPSDTSVEHSADGLYCPVCGTELKLKLVKADE